MRVYIVGPGGCGQTHVMHQFRKAKIAINHFGDHDNLKHKPSPPGPSKMESFTHVCFVFNHGLSIACSLFRRRYLNAQLRKLGNPQPNKFKTASLDDFLAHMEKSGVDELRLLNQFENWKTKCKKPIIFLDTADPDFEKKINEFLPGDNTVSFQWKEEKRNTKSTVTNMREKYPKVTAMYDNIYDQMKANS